MGYQGVSVPPQSKITARMHSRVSSNPCPAVFPFSRRSDLRQTGVIVTASNRDEEMILRKALPALAPFDHHGGLDQRRVEIKVVELREVVAEPVGVDVDQRDAPPALRRTVLAGDDERGRADPALDAK